MITKETDRRRYRASHYIHYPTKLRRHPTDGVQSINQAANLNTPITENKNETLDPGQVVYGLE